jgi:phosphoglycolate phosphatase
MPKQFDLIVFDWDGTLVDSTHAIVESILGAAEDVGLPLPTEAAARGIIGLELHAAIAALFEGISDEQVRFVAERYRYHFLVRDHAIPMFDGVAEAIEELVGEGFMLSVATGKTRRGLDRAMTTTELHPHFLASRCADECFSKPHPQMLHEIMDELGVMPERTLMIGDTSYDLQMASNAGVSSLAVSYGAQPLENLLEYAPLAHFDRFTKLHQWLIINA